MFVMRPTSDTSTATPSQKPAFVARTHNTQKRHPAYRCSLARKAQALPSVWSCVTAESDRAAE